MHFYFLKTLSQVLIHLARGVGVFQFLASYFVFSMTSVSNFLRTPESFSFVSENHYSSIHLLYVLGSICALNHIQSAADWCKG